VGLTEQREEYDRETLMTMSRGIQNQGLLLKDMKFGRQLDKVTKNLQSGIAHSKFFNDNERVATALNGGRNIFSSPN
jgi:hypothetical protein